MVQRETEPIVISNCFNRKLDEKLIKFGVEADLIISPGVNIMRSQNFAAYANLCGYELFHNKRQLMGIIEFNPDFLNFNMKDAEEFLTILIQSSSF